MTGTNLQLAKPFRKDHNEHLRVFKAFQGRTFSTSQIKKMMATQSSYKASSIIPSDHCTIHKGCCGCAGTDNKIFDAAGRGKFTVRPVTASIVGQGTQSPQFSCVVKLNNTSINHLWHSNKEDDWLLALAHYWMKINPRNLVLEVKLNSMNIKSASAINDWYAFIYDEYMPWKYNTSRHYKPIRSSFSNTYANNRNALLKIVSQLFSAGGKNIKQRIQDVTQIKGIGTAGATTLLAIIFPHEFGGADQYVIKGLQKIPSLHNAQTVAKIKPDSITVDQAVIVTKILQEKAADLNSIFGTNMWTPRRVDMILWGFR